MNAFQFGCACQAVITAVDGHGITLASNADEYIDYLNKTGIMDYQSTEGNLGVQLLRRVGCEQA